MLREHFEEVLSRYPAARSTPLAGNPEAKLVRETLPRDIARAASISSQYLVVGSPGKGNWAEIPWVSVFDTAITRSAEEGYYAVYLFDAEFGGYYLSLNQGWTQYEREFGLASARKRIRQTARRLQNLLKSTLSDFSFDPINLHATHALGRGYELGHICGKWYPANGVPNDDVLIDDLRNLLGVYRELKGQVGSDIFDIPRLARIRLDQQDEGTPPDPDAPNEISEVVARVEEVAGKPIRPGMIMSPELRKAIESHAMTSAMQHLREAKWEVEDVSASNPFDLRCKRGEELLFVEVKGTTTNGKAVVLTPNEVSHATNKYPATALILVHGIVIGKDGKPTGGRIRYLVPWEIDDGDLKPLAFSYTVPLEP